VDGTAYQYLVRTYTALGFVDSEASQAAVSSPQWFAMGRSSILVVGILFSAAVLIFIRRARKGESLFIRKIPGLDAVDDAVGRATEMGRPVLYVPGIETVSEVGTLAALTILGHVAKRVAQHGTPLIVPCSDAIVMSTAQEIVKTAYAEVGQSDNYDPSRISYLTYDQFGYAAGVDGIMMRERPRRCSSSLLRRGVPHPCRDGTRDRGHPDLRHQGDLAASVLRRRVRLHPDRRGALRRVELPVPRARDAGEPEGPGLGEALDRLLHDLRFRGRDGGPPHAPDGSSSLSRFLAP